MGELRIDKLSDTEFDVLKEISNIGTGNAATAVSQLLGGRVDINIPVIKFLNFTELSDVLGGAEKEVIGILVTLERDIDGMMMFILDRNSAAIVVNRMLEKKVECLSSPLSDMERSVLTEFGNIISGTYITALSLLTGLKVSSSVPALSDDMAGAILSVPATEFAKISDKVLLIQSLILAEGDEVEGFFVLIPTRHAFNNIFENLGLKKVNDQWEMS